MDEEKKEEEKIEVKENSQKKSDITKKVRENPWILATFVCGILAVILIISTLFGGTTGNVISANDAGEKLIDFYESTGIEGLTLNSVNEVSGLYQVNLNYEESIISFYVTKDGKSFVNENYMIPIEEEVSSETETEITKSDKPIVELFVMSYCPYGTQAEKGIIPVVKLLGDKIDFKIRYVDYLMHGEKEGKENLREYCIQKIAPEKFLDYMTCFLEGDGEVSSSGYITNGNDVNTCIAKAGIDTSELNSCISETDKEYSVTENLEAETNYPRFNVDAELNDEYGVEGSPTLVINGQIVSSGRSSASYLDIICSAFNNVPEVCSTELSSETPSPYFGWESSGSSTTASCG
jgi:hypothetical protein